jgi:hypothetical protein
MIESCYWKEELQRIARLLKPSKNPPRWSERAHCVLERELIVGFFILRRMIELNKVSSGIRDRQLKVFNYLATGKKVTRLNGHDVVELYDMEKENSVTKKPFYISNQFVHAFTSFLARDETRNWSDMFVVSDYDKNNCIWRVPTSLIHDLFMDASQDYPPVFSMTWNNEKNDYDCTTN